MVLYLMVDWLDKLTLARVTIFNLANYVTLGSM